MTETGFILPLSIEVNRDVWSQNLASWGGLKPIKNSSPITIEDCARIVALSEVDSLFGTHTASTGITSLVKTDRDSISGVAHVMKTIDHSLNERPRSSFPYSSLVYTPSYLGAVSFLENRFGIDPQIIKRVLLAGSMGSLSAHDVAAVAGSINPEARLSVVDIVPGTLSETSRRGAYNFFKQDVTASLSTGQDIIMTNILLGFLGEGLPTSEQLRKIEQFFKNSYGALNDNGALVMVERNDIVTQDMIGLLKKQGFKVFRKPAPKFRNRFIADQFFAGTGRNFPEGSVEQSTREQLIIAVKAKE